MLLLRIPNRDSADDGDVRADEFLGAKNPDLGVIGISRKHHVLAQKLATETVS